MSTQNIMTKEVAEQLGVDWTACSKPILLGDGSSVLDTAGVGVARVKVAGRAPTPVDFVIVERLVEPIIIGIHGGSQLGLGVVGLPLVLPESRETKKQRASIMSQKDEADGVLEGKPSEPRTACTGPSPGTMPFL
tara:strand:+ start:1240 stop:1644 length:405 start_codon:yes stop_codon:yes gene_type:complete